MAEKRLAKARATLPEGYQFGDADLTNHYQRLYDAAKAAEPMLGATTTIRLPEKYVNITSGQSWNVIEGEH